MKPRSVPVRPLLAAHLLALGLLIYPIPAPGEAEPAARSLGPPKQKTFEAALQEEILEKTESLGAEHPETLRVRALLAGLWYVGDRFAEAEEELRTLITLRERVLGPEDPETLATRDALAVTLGDEKKFAEAEAEFRAVLAVRERVLGPDHPETLASRSNLATALRARGNLAEAEAGHRAVRALRERVLGPEHPATLASRNNVAQTLLLREEFPEAEAEFRRLHDLLKRAFGPEHWYVFLNVTDISSALRAQGSYKEAKPFVDLRLELLNRNAGCEFGFVPPRRIRALHLAGKGQYAEAEALLRAARDLMMDSSHPEGLEILDARGSLAHSLHDQGKDDEALVEATAAYAGCRKVLGDDHPRTAKAKRLVEVLKSEMEVE